MIYSHYKDEEEKIFEDPSNLHDEMKMKLLKKAYDKYTLEELMEKLDLKYNDF